MFGEAESYGWWCWGGGGGGELAPWLPFSRGPLSELRGLRVWVFLDVAERATIQRDRLDGKALGMGFVVFRREEDADAARLALHKHAYGYQILNVEKAQPRTNRGPAAPRPELRTGYGRALPQFPGTGAGGAR
jgi:RNA recognition motif-containing protein